MADFEYTYSAPEQEEIRKIREKYVPKEETTLEKLRRLDAKAEKPGMIVSLTLGIIGTLIFGTGMCCCLVWELYLIGVIVGLDFAANFVIDTFNIETAVLMNHAVGYHVMAGVGCLLIMMLGLLSSTEGVAEYHEEDEEEEEEE